MKPLFLIADDSQAKRDFLAHYVMKQLDVQILLASHTEQAMQIIKEHVEIAAAFVDYEMPSEQGPAVIRALKKHAPQCLVALVTSADSAKYKKDAEEAGADVFICTSWPLDEVEQKITTLLEEWKERIENV